MTIREFFFPAHGTLRALPYTVMAAAGLVLGSTLGLADLTQRLEWSFYDRLHRADIAGSAEAPGLVIVAIDELSFSEIGLQWPWPRFLHAAVIDQVARGGARAIVVDILFDTPGASADDDAALVETVRGAGNVVLASQQAVVEDRSYAVEQWADPFPALAEAAAAVAAVRIPLDPDGVVRRMTTAVDGRMTLAAAAAGLAHGTAQPAGAGRPLLFRYNGAPRRGIRTVSYYQVLDAGASLPDDVFRDKVVFVGHALAAPVGAESGHFATPLGVRMAGVEIHATAYDALARGRLIADPFGSGNASMLLATLIGALAAALLFRLGPVPGAAAVLAAGGALAAMAFALLAGPQVRIPVLPPVLSMISVYAATAGYRYALLMRERRLIKRAFQSYVAPAIVEQMLSDPSKLRLGGQEYDVTVMFSDLEGFTTLSERLGPEALRAHLSGYFKTMVDLLLAERATLDKFIGDAIMVYFGCPIADPSHPAQTCRGALAMQRPMAVLNREWAARGIAPLRTRIGINSGRVVAGNMGTDTIFNFTVLGDTVNLAARLEGVYKEYRTLIIIGEATHSRISGEFETRELDWIRVKGKERPVAIYELAAAAGDLADERRAVFAHYADGLAFYRDKKWSAAAAAFTAALALDPEDSPSRVFLQRCHDYAAGSPLGAWDGVHVMTTK